MREDYVISGGELPIFRSEFIWTCEKTCKQALRLGLLVGQALERSDNPAKTCRKGQPLRVGLSNQTHIVAGML